MWIAGIALAADIGIPRAGAKFKSTDNTCGWMFVLDGWLLSWILGALLLRVRGRAYRDKHVLLGNTKSEVRWSPGSGQSASRLSIQSNSQSACVRARWGPRWEHTTAFSTFHLLPLPPCHDPPSISSSPTEEGNEVPHTNIPPGRMSLLLASTRSPSLSLHFFGINSARRNNAQRYY